MYSKELSTLPDVIFLYLYFAILSTPSRSHCRWSGLVSAIANSIQQRATPWKHLHLPCTLHPTTILAVLVSVTIIIIKYAFHSGHSTPHYMAIDMPFAHVKGCNLLLLFSMELVFIVIRFIFILHCYYHCSGCCCCLPLPDAVTVMILHCWAFDF